MDIEIISYREEYAHYFSSMNKAWIEQYFVVEALDKMFLDDPEKHIIDRGGLIFFAKTGDEIAGTMALIKITDDTFELAKMAVDPKFQGMKIGNRMMTFAITKAKEMNLSKLILYSNTSLQPAIHLYKKFGFKEVAIKSSDFSRANIKMELNLK